MSKHSQPTPRRRLNLRRLSRSWLLWSHPMGWCTMWGQFAPHSSLSRCWHVKQHVDQELILSDSSVKSKQEIPKLTESGLAKLDLDGGIVFSKMWTYDQVVNALCEYLPEVFEYLNKLPEADTHHWVLCFRQQSIITPGLGVTFPMGKIWISLKEIPGQLGLNVSYGSVHQIILIDEGIISPRCHSHKRPHSSRYPQVLACQIAIISAKYVKESVPPTPFSFFKSNWYLQGKGKKTGNHNHYQWWRLKWRG